MKKFLILMLFLLGGILLGTLLTKIAEQVSFLKWLCWGDSIGIGYPNPATVDLSVLKLQFGISLQMNIAKLLSIIVSLVLFLKVGKKL